MKHIFKFIAAIVCTVALTPTATAQQYDPVTLLVTSAVPFLPSAATNTTASQGIVTVTDYQNLGVQITCNWSNTALDNAVGGVIATFSASLDGTSWMTNYAFLNAVCPTNRVQATNFVWLTNMNLGAIGYLKLHSLTNASNTGFVTNITVKVVNKPSWREFR